MDVACSTFCFTKEPLEQALRHIAELEFGKVDLGVAAGGNHLRPEEVADDANAVLQRVRRGPTIGVAGVTARLDAAGEPLVQQVSALAHLAQQLSTAVLTIDAAPAATPLADEVKRLARLAKEASLRGVGLCVLTKPGTIAERPETAAELCQKVPGLGLTFDPSYFLGDASDTALETILPYVRHLNLRDSGRGPGQFQVSIGRGEIDYSRIINSLRRFHYRGALVVAIEDAIPCDLDIEAEVRKLNRVLESLV